MTNSNKLRANLVRRALIASVLVICSAASFGQDVYRVSVGSYSNLENARNALRVINANLAGGFELVRADTTATALYRILSQPYETRAEARRAVAAAERADIMGAWIVVSQLQRIVGSAPTPSPIASSARHVDVLSTQSATSTTNETSNTVPLNGAKGVPVQLAEQSYSASAKDAIRILKTTESAAAIKIDGLLDESIWSTCPMLANSSCSNPIRFVPHATNILAHR